MASPPMKIAIAADHAGFQLKQKLAEMLRRQGHDVTDFGTTSEESTDYPDFAVRVARDVADGTAERGLLVCSTGVGMSIAANKVPGVRAALGTQPDEVKLVRSHNDANVLALGAKFIGEQDAGQLVELFLNTPFDGGRHERRLKKIEEIENANRATK